MYLSVISTIFGILILLSGIAGFVPAYNMDGLLFDTFQVDTVHNVFNIVVGIIALLCSFKYKSDRLFFQVFGIIYGLIAIATFVFGGDLIITQLNVPDNVLHFFIAVVFLVIGFSADKEGEV